MITAIEANNWSDIMFVALMVNMWFDMTNV